MGTSAGLVGCVVSCVLWGFASAAQVCPPTMATMKHIVNPPGCTAEELTLGESARPDVGPGEVLIEVHFAGVGATDIALRKGTSHVKPKEGTPPHHLILGLELSGIVTELGEGTTAFNIGDRVCALVYGGGYAEWTVVPQEQVLLLPDNMSLEVGATLPENFFTVWANVFHPAAGNLLENPEQKTLLVHGGAGGIGSTAIALAHRMGAKVITTISSESKAEAVKRFGADVAINYKTEDFVERVKEETDGKGVDVILCFIGGEYTARNIEALANYGRLVQIGLRGGREVSFDWKILMNKWATMTGGHLRPRTIEQKGQLRDALREHVVPLWTDGSLPMPEVHAILPLAEAGKAQLILENSEVIGKVILKCKDE